jgi:hypothetical protein
MSDPVISVYVNRAQKFAEGMRFLRERPEHLMAAGLLAVHSAIAFNDAVLMKLTGRSGLSQDHKRAPAITRKACHERRLDDRGISHLKELIDFKDEIAYQGKPIAPEKITRMCKTAERFEAWAKPMLKGDI